MQHDKAEVGRLGDLLSRVGAGLDEFLKFEHPDAIRTSGRARQS
jgi:aromatic-L-amino-acid decarboxylase